MRWLADAGQSLETTTNVDGEFVLKHVVQGSYRLTAEADGLAEASTDAFEVRGDRSGFVLRLGTLGVLTGTVRGISDDEREQVRVAAVPMANLQSGPGGMFGGRGRGGLRTVSVQPDDTYRIEDLEPGDYVVRSWIGSPGALLRDVGARATEGTLPPDVTVRGGETARLDLTLNRPQVGIVAGSVLHNGNAGAGLHVELTARDANGASRQAEAPRGPGGPGGRFFENFGRSFQATVAASGRFTIENVPAGDYLLRIQTSRRGGTLHEEAVLVTANATTERSLVVTSQSLRGRITRDDGGDPAQLTGRVSLLPDQVEVPQNLNAWLRQNPSFNARLQGGEFRFDTIPAGKYLLVVTMPDRERSVQSIAVGAGMAEIAVPAGAASSASARSGASANDNR
jgi:hypothetical protein